MATIREMFGMGKKPPDKPSSSAEDDLRIHTEFQDEEIEKSIKVLGESGLQPDKIERRISRQVQETLEGLGANAATRIHVVSRGYCPSCGSKLKQHLYTNICLECGWNQYTVPPKGPVKLRLKNGDAIQGETCYILKDGSILVLRRDVVVARVNKEACETIEYDWSDDDIKTKEEQRLNEEKFLCSWCEGEATPDKEGFNIVYLALGTHQNRYIFCCDDCLEAFRTRYPSRVHRNCYEVDCGECNLCTKRFDTTLDSYMIMKRARDKIRAREQTQP